MTRALLAFTLALLVCLAPGAAGLSIMSYNVENLFDDVRDGSEFREFDPGRADWNTEFFMVRVQSIAEVVRKALPGGPDILLLQEVENEHALDTLVEEGLRGMGYAYRSIVPKKRLAANVAIVSRLPILRIRTHAVGPWKGAPVRDILEAELSVDGRTLYLFNNHWKSKSDGVKATEVSRLEAAAVLGRRIREILAGDPNADILAAGDMNESLDEYALTGRKYQTALIPETEAAPERYAPASIFLSGNARGLGVMGDRLVLYEPWFEVQASRRGSYAYQEEWLTVDHMLLSPGLLDTQGFAYRWGSFTVVRQPFLLDADGLPKRWTGLVKARGYSDHLPILIALDQK
jgi:endonuclease/exonuclease/phosphatase family metal-dependent hydrolase